MEGLRQLRLNACAAIGVDAAGEFGRAAQGLIDAFAGDAEQVRA